MDQKTPALLAHEWVITSARRMERERWAWLAHWVIEHGEADCLGVCLVTEFAGKFSFVMKSPVPDVRRCKDLGIALGEMHRRGWLVRTKSGIGGIDRTPGVPRWRYVYRASETIEQIFQS
ncbi:MAG: hypothetical protein RLZZ373_3238 [Pseudomonadota bacterium]|jgi:hypothetical protein